MDDKISRRSLLALLPKHALVLPALSRCLSAGEEEQIAALKSMPAEGTAQDNKFMLYIHFGSADGLTTGMLPPRGVVIDGSESDLPQVGAWPQGLFEHEEVANSINHNVNIHYQDQGKSLIFNEYSKVLQPLQDHLCVAVGNSRSLSHHDAAAFQITGDRLGSGRGSWVANFAQALHGSNNFVNVVAAPSTASTREIIYTSIFNHKGYHNDNIALINAASLDEAHTMLSDPAGIPHADGQAHQFWQALNSINSGIGGKYDAVRKSVNYYIENLTAGAPELAQGSALRSEIEAKLNMDELKARLRDTSLPGGAVCDMPSRLFNTKASAQLVANLQLAAGLAGSRRAKGMLLSFGDHDTHGGGSSIHTPRQGSILFAAVRLFWEWVIAQKLQDDVMVIISHDFTRTAYNSKSGGTRNLKIRQSSGIDDDSLITRGTDHQQIMSMMFINGKVPAAGQIGALADNYTAFGSQNAQGMPDTDIAPYTSDTLVGGMLLRCFDDVFKDEAAVKEFFPGFKVPSPDPFTS